MEVTRRCDAVIVQICVTEIDAQGRPVGELTSSPIKIFRATAENFWAEVDQAIARLDRKEPHA